MTGERLLVRILAAIGAGLVADSAVHTAGIFCLAMTVVFTLENDQ